VVAVAVAAAAEARTVDTHKIQISINRRILPIQIHKVVGDNHRHRSSGGAEHNNSVRLCPYNHVKGDDHWLYAIYFVKFQTAQKI
jgi:hypothetical protein